MKPSDLDKVQIYHMPPPLLFEVIEKAKGHGVFTASWKRVEEAMKKKVASIEGGAVVLIGKREQYAETYTTASTSNAFVYGKYIYYTY